MISESIPKDQKNISVKRENTKLVISEDDGALLAMILPPIDDIAEIEWLSSRNFSINDLVSTKFKLQDNLFINEFEKLKSKIEKFPESAILLNRLANLASINGNLELEADYLNKASLLSNSEFFIHRIGDNLIGRGEITEARNIFGKLNIKSDHYANLRFASLLVGENRVDEASEYVERAVEIDPIEYSSRLFQGALRLLKGSAEKAISSFRIAIEDRPTSSVAYANLALAYAKLSLDKKAVGALRRAVSLNPLNSNALIMLADLSFKIGQNKDAVSALKYYVQYEQKSSPHWERLARALLAMGSTSEAIEALKRQASVERSSAVWNNLGGVAYHIKRDFKKSLSALKHAMSIDAENPTTDFFIAARNTAVFLGGEKENKNLFDFTKLIITRYGENLIVKDKILSDLVVMHVYTLAKSGDVEAATAKAEAVLNNPDAVFQLKIFAATALLSFYAMRNGMMDKALALAEEMIKILDNFHEDDRKLKERLINNIAYVFAETGQIERANFLLAKISYLIHKEAYCVFW